MRTWISFRTGIPGIRVGASLPNPSARVYRVSATGAKICRVASAVILVSLAIGLIASRDDDGRLNEKFLLVIGLVLGLCYIFKLVVVAFFPPIETPPTK